MCHSILRLSPFHICVTSPVNISPIQIVTLNKEQVVALDSVKIKMIQVWQYPSFMFEHVSHPSTRRGGFKILHGGVGKC